ncbi:hypothetical protein [Phenylobacterium sp.]|uniref:hypothetical protein n=1 Tax=Phenylobacterium sp. TaxID=1871053 RepID=UPI0035AF55C7
MKLALPIAAALSLASAAGAQDAQRVWSVETPKDAEAALRFGTPATDDQPIAFSCARKSGQVRVAASLSAQLGVQQAGGAWVDKAGLREPWPMSVVLTSQGAALNLRGAGRVNEITGGTTATAEFSTLAPFAAAFRKSGAVTLSAAGETLAPPPAPKSQVRKFLGACK